MCLVLKGCEIMTFCLGALLKTIKKYEMDPSDPDIIFVNNLCGCITSASSDMPCNFNNSDVSKILSCKRNVPDCLKANIRKNELKKKLILNLHSYVEENLVKDIYNDLTLEILTLCDRSNKSQVSICDKLNNIVLSNSKSDKNCEREVAKLSRFLAAALIEAVQIANKVETTCSIRKYAGSELCLLSGDIFKFGFGRYKTNNIVVIPVNTRFDTHISRKFEGQVKQVVSSKTLHGMWLDRMARRSNTKEKVDNTYACVDEEKLSQRINEDLKLRGYKSDNCGEYPFGTIAVIEEGNTIFYLLAISKFDDNNNAHATKAEIKAALNSLVQFYDRNGQGQDMYLPLIGTGMSRAGFSYKESFSEICDSFNPENNLFVGKVIVVVEPEIFENLKLEIENVL